MPPEPILSNWHTRGVMTSENIFSYRIFSIWNSLLSEVVNATSPNSFKNRCWLF